MHIGQIEVDKDYFGYDCLDNGPFRLIRYHVLAKATWSLQAARYLVDKHLDIPLSNWTGYPDNLYSTAEAAVKALQANVETLKDELENRGPHMVNGINIVACCTTCSHFMHETQFCTEFKDYMCCPDTQICKERAYSCDPAMINSEVYSKQRPEKGSTHS